MVSKIVIYLLVIFIAGSLQHCQVPCGIYDDPARVNQLLEDVTTIGKAVKEIDSLHNLKESTATQSNQFVRWVNTKEKHASNMITILSEYFMVQRVPEGDIEFLQQVHHTMKLAMKAKQTVDLSVVESLHNAVHALGERYHMWDVVAE